MLDDMDIGYLRDRNASQPFWDQVDRELGFIEKTMVTTYIDNNGSPTGPYQETVTVVSGDTLGTIADRYLNDRNRWGEIYAMNRRTIGTNPDHIEVGQVLRMPQL